MKHPTRSCAVGAVVLVLSIVAGACGGAARTNAEMEALAARNRRPHAPADAHFMTMMIPHHAQAVLFAGWAETHDAGSAVRILAARMVVAQRDEIETMRTWLGERGEPVPPAEYRRGMRGDHMSMPGMLTEAQLDELDAARGEAFDRLFLTYMIPHHEGAIMMVDELFASDGGAQDDFVFKLASDIAADQEIEIERMRGMLEQYPPGAPEPPEPTASRVPAPERGWRAPNLLPPAPERSPAVSSTPARA